MTPLEEKIEEGVKYLLTYPEVRASASMESDIRLVLNSIATQAIEAENQAWRNGERCENCGKPSNQTGLSDWCIECYENE